MSRYSWLDEREFWRAVVIARYHYGGDVLAGIQHVKERQA